MKNRWFKKAVALGLISAMAVTGFAGCGTKKKDAENSFTWWIYTQDDDGQWYTSYEESPAVQYINQQYWDSENGGIGDEETGKQLNFSFQVPVKGSESDNFNTMISTGEYPEIVDTVVSADSAEALNEAGIAMDITEYVNQYMPNYLAYLEEHPDLKPWVTVTKDDGVHYYAVYSLLDGVENPWQGNCYRRDWLVKYATPSEYVWDWDSTSVQANGHPEVTPLAKAKSSGNLNGWKKNEVTSFTADYGKDPNNDYTDNVIFPSGTSDPITISDWEWMFEAFAKAIDERGWRDDSSSYCTTIQYCGYSALGDLVSSFGGGNGTFYVKDGTVSYSGISENMQSYVEAMQTWYKNGWLDTEFNTRASDIFYNINSAGVTQGKVGMWDGLNSTLGTAIRTSCANAEDSKDAFVMGAALPMNDMYGTADQMFKEPDCMFQTGKRGTATIITDKAKDKDLATLFTYLDWTYTTEGALVKVLGLNEEQYKSVKLNPDIMADNGLTCAYTTSTNEEGKTVYTRTVNNSNTLQGALTSMRMDTGIKLNNSEERYIDGGNTTVIDNAFEQYTKYTNTGGTMDYNKLMNTEESKINGTVGNEISDYVNQNLPSVIKGEMKWSDYKAGLDKLDAQSIVDIYQKYVTKFAELAK